MDMISGIKSFWSPQKQQAVRDKIRRLGKKKRLEPLAMSLIEAMASCSSYEIEEIFTSDKAFDESATSYLHKLLSEKLDPRESAKDFAWLKRELKITTEKQAPLVLTRVILSESRGHGAAEGILIQVGKDRLEAVVAFPSNAMRPGAVVEVVFDDGLKMAGLSAIVKEVEANETYGVVRLAPGRGGFKKREHFRVDLKIPATVLIRSDEVAYMPGDDGKDVKVLAAELVNLSGGGGRMKLKFPVAVGDRLCIAFPIDSSDKPLGAEGKVVWAKKEGDSDWFAGFEFEPMAKEDLLKLILFLFRKQTDQVKKSLSKL